MRTLIQVMLLSCLFTLASSLVCQAQDSRAISFDKNWRFRKDTLTGAEQPQYSDKGWRLLNLPHDWSIEDLPNQKEGEVQGPFTKTSVGKAATGFTEGGIGWYRKSFLLDRTYQSKNTYIIFDAVYMDADVWIENIPYNETRDYVQRIDWHRLVFAWRRSGAAQDPSFLLGQITPVAATPAAEDLPP